MPIPTLFAMVRCTSQQIEAIKIKKFSYAFEKFQFNYLQQQIGNFTIDDRNEEVVEEKSFACVFKVVTKKEITEEENEILAADVGVGASKS